MEVNTPACVDQSGLVLSSLSLNRDLVVGNVATLLSCSCLVFMLVFDRLVDSIDWISFTHSDILAVLCVPIVHHLSTSRRPFSHRMLPIKF